MNVTDPIRRAAASVPDTVALVEADGALVTYGELDRRIDRCGRRALELGLAPGQIAALGIGGPDEALALVVALGLARAGIASADPHLPSRHLAAALVQRGAQVAGTRNLVFDRSWLSGPDAELASDQSASRTFRILATSGTTGTSRFCAVSHAAMAARNASAAARMVVDRPVPILVCAIGLGGAAGLRAAISVLDAGGQLVFTNIAQVANAMLRHGVTALIASAKTLQQILDRIPAGVGPLPSLSVIQVSGSHLPGKLALKAMQRLCPNVITAFGSTESGHIADGRYGAFAAIPLAIGHIAPAVEVQAVDANDAVLTPGLEGLLRIRAPGMVTGYFDDEATSRSVFRDGWFYSGDRGAVMQDRVVTVTGRTGDFINSGGVKVDPRVIEQALLSIPEVKEAVAFAAPDSDGLPQIWAGIVAEAPVPTATLNRLCADRLGHRSPKIVLQLKELPRNENGKIVTRQLIELASRHYAVQSHIP